MPRRPAPRLVPYALVAALGVAAPRARAEDPGVDAESTGHHTLRLELGPELDTNARRSEIVHAPGIVSEAPVVSALSTNGIAIPYISTTESGSAYAQNAIGSAVAASNRQGSFMFSFLSFSVYLPGSLTSGYLSNSTL